MEKFIRENKKMLCTFFGVHNITIENSIVTFVIMEEMGWGNRELFPITIDLENSTIFDDDFIEKIVELKKDIHSTETEWVSEFGEDE